MFLVFQVWLVILVMRIQTHEIRCLFSVLLAYKLSVNLFQINRILNKVSGIYAILSPNSLSFGTFLSADYLTFNHIPVTKSYCFL